MKKYIILSGIGLLFSATVFGQRSSMSAVELNSVRTYEGATPKRMNVPANEEVWDRRAKSSDPASKNYASSKANNQVPAGKAGRISVNLGKIKKSDGSRVVYFPFKNIEGVYNAQQFSIRRSDIKDYTYPDQSGLSGVEVYERKGIMLHFDPSGKKGGFEETLVIRLIDGELFLNLSGEIVD